MQASVPRNPRPEAQPFVPNTIYDANTFTGPSLGNYGGHWSNPLMGAPTTYRQAPEEGVDEYESGSSKRKRALQPPPTLDVEACRIAIPDINQLTSLVQIQSAMYEKAMQRILVLERSNNKLLDYCNSMVKWSQSVTAVNLMSSATADDMTPQSRTEEAVQS